MKSVETKVQENDHNPADLPSKFVRNKDDQKDEKEEEVK